MAIDLSRLNENQRKAVLTTEGMVQIDAVPGSGKTTVLVHRLAYMIEQGIEPESILCTTFTKKASEEMIERMSKFINKRDVKEMTIGTTHSIAYRILKHEYNSIGHPLAEAFKNDMLTGNTQKIFMEKIKKEIMLDKTFPFHLKENLRDLTVPNLTRIIGLCKSSGIKPSDFKTCPFYKETIHGEIYLEVYTRYEKAKSFECKIDLDDLLVLLVDLFQENKQILAKYQAKYKYLLVDESQDNNGLQYKIVEMLAKPQNNLFLVGDTDQSMYSFRGAKPKEFVSFGLRYRNVNRIPLEDNYRSNPDILNHANTLIKHNTERLEKRLVPYSTDDAQGVVYNYYDCDTDEASDIAKEIESLVKNDGVAPKDIAVLFRTNAMSRIIEEQLILKSLPYVIHSGISFYERKEVKDIVAYLELAENPKNKTAFKRVINVPSRYLGKAFMAKVESYNGSPMDALKSGTLDLKSYEKRGSEQFVELIDMLHDMYERKCSTTEILDAILYEGGYMDYLREQEDGEEDSSRAENIDTLRYAISNYPTLSDFLDYMDEMMNNAKTDVNGVQLLTIHKSKGLEYPVVFIHGCQDGVLPHFRAVEKSEKDPIAIEEERRLLYVAITRAKNKVYISSSGSFLGRPAKTSRFLYEMGLPQQKFKEEYNDNTRSS